MHIKHTHTHTPSQTCIYVTSCIPLHYVCIRAKPPNWQPGNLSLALAVYKHTHTYDWVSSPACCDCAYAVHARSMPKMYKCRQVHRYCLACLAGCWLLVAGYWLLMCCLHASFSSVCLRRWQRCSLFIYMRVVVVAPVACLLASLFVRSLCL